MWGTHVSTEGHTGLTGCRLVTLKTSTSDSAPKQCVIFLLIQHNVQVSGVVILDLWAVSQRNVLFSDDLSEAVHIN